MRHARMMRCRPPEGSRACHRTLMWRGSWPTGWPGSSTRHWPSRPPSGKPAGQPMSKRIFAVVVLNISDEAIADTPERAIGKEEDRLERALTSEYEVETVDVFRVEHYTGRWSAR